MGAKMNVKGSAKGRSHNSTSTGRAWLAAAALLALTGCSSLPIPTDVPTAQSIADLKPSGAVTMTEIFAGGAGVGKGVLTYKDKSYPFKLIGTVIGPAPSPSWSSAATSTSWTISRNSRAPMRRAMDRSACRHRARATSGCKTRPA